MKENEFSIRTGVCRVTDKEIIISKTGPMGGVASSLFGEKIAGLFGIQLAIAVVLFANSIYTINDGNYFLGAVLGAAAVLLVRGILQNRNASNVNLIPISEII